MIATLPANSDSLADSGLTANTQYYYQLVTTGSNAETTAVNTNTTTQSGDLVDSLAMVSSAIVTLIAGETLPLVAVATLGEEEIDVGTAAN